MTERVAIPSTISVRLVLYLYTYARSPLCQDAHRSLGDLEDMRYHLSDARVHCCLTRLSSCCSHHLPHIRRWWKQWSQFDKEHDRVCEDRETQCQRKSSVMYKQDPLLSESDGNMCEDRERRCERKSALMTYYAQTCKARTATGTLARNRECVGDLSMIVSDPLERDCDLRDVAHTVT